MHRLCCILFLLLPFCLSAQELDIDWKRSFEGKFEETILQTIIDYQGNIVMVGTTTKGQQGKKNGLFRILDPSNGQTIVERYLGRDLDDTFYTVVQTPDSNYVLAGFTETKGKHKEDAWIIKVDGKGRKKWEKISGTIGKDIVVKLDVLPNGNVVGIGYLNSGEFGDIWLLQIKDGKFIWENVIGEGKFAEVRGFLATKGGQLALVGSTYSRKSKLMNIWFMRTDYKGYPVGKITYLGGNKWEEATDLIQTQEGGFAIGGLTRSKGAGSTDMWLIKLDERGNRMWDMAFGGKDADLANTLIQCNNGGFALLGKSKSDQPADWQFQPRLLITNPYGNKAYETNLPQALNQSGSIILELPDDSLLIIGADKQEKQTWIIKTQPLNIKEPLVGQKR